MTVAIIYAAKSTEDKNGSIATQLEDCRAMAAREGWDVVAEFEDEAYSAWKGDRGPGLKAACEKAAILAAEHGSCVLGAQHSDRLARGDGRQARHLGELLFWAMRADVELRSVQDDSTFTNPLLAFAMGERNAEDSRRKSLAVKSGMKRRAAKGKHNGGIRPFGFIWQGAKGEKFLVVLAAEKVIVVRIFEDTARGLSQLSIARNLEAEGVRTVTGAAWQQPTVRQILMNPIYIGMVRLNGEVMPGEHERIVSDDLWARAQAAREARARRRGNGGGRLPKGRHLLIRGTFKCGTCGSTMIPVTKPTRTEGTIYERYICHNHLKHGNSFCAQEPLRRDEIDTALWNEFERAHVDLAATRERIAAKINHDLAVATAAADDAEREEREVAAQRARVEHDYVVAGELSAANYERISARLDDELEAASAAVERQKAQAEFLRAGGPLRDAEEEALRRIARMREIVLGGFSDEATIEEARAIIRTLFEKIVYRPADHPITSLKEYAASSVPVVKGYVEFHPRGEVADLYDEEMDPIDRRVIHPAAEKPITTASRSYRFFDYAFPPVPIVEPKA